MAGFHNILVPVDGSEPSRRAFEMALTFAREPGGRIRLVHVLDEIAYASAYEYSGAFVEETRQQAREFMESRVREGMAKDVPCDMRLIEEPASRLGELIAREAQEWHADLIVVGSHGRRGLGRLLLGSGAEQIVRLAPVPILVVREPRDQR